MFIAQIHKFLENNMCGLHLSKLTISYQEYHCKYQKKKKKKKLVIFLHKLNVGTS